MLRVASYTDTLQGARSALRYARDAARSGDGWNRLMIELPLPPPGCALGDLLRPDSDAVWPGGVTQRHRVAMRPLVDELLSGYDPAYLGTIDVGQMGVWSIADLTAVSFVADLSFAPFAKLARGGFGDAPTRDGHTLLLLNPRLTTAANVGQPWERSLRREAQALVDDGGWRWIYAARPLGQPDGSLLGTVVSSCVPSEPGGSQLTCACAACGDEVARWDEPAATEVRSAFGRDRLAGARATLGRLRGGGALALYPRRAVLWGAVGLGVVTESRSLTAVAAPGDMLRVQGVDPSAVPRLGRFEPLTGAKAFIGEWRLAEASEPGGPSGRLVFLRNGDVELRSVGGALLGAGVQPWTYVSPRAPDTVVRLSFTLDCEGGVGAFDATLDAADGPTRLMRGSYSVGVGRARGTGAFSATPVVVLVEVEE